MPTLFDLLMTGLLSANTILLLRLVFQAGRAFQKVEDIDVRLRRLEDAHVKE